MEIDDDKLYSIETDIDKIKTKTVERLIAPLVHLVTSLHADHCPQGQNNRDGQEVLLRLQESLGHFLKIGAHIVQNYPLAVGKALEQLNNALGHIQQNGSELLNVGAQFVANAGNHTLRAKTVDAGRATLMAVAKLLIMADMVDAHILLKQAQKVCDLLDNTDRVDSTKELMESCTKFDSELQILTDMTRRRLHDLRDPSEQEDLQSAIAMLKITTPIMVASTRAFVSHPELDATRTGRDYAMGEMRNALNCFRSVLQGRPPTDDVAISRYGRINELVCNLDEFQKRIHMDPTTYNSAKHHPQLEELLERIAAGAAVIADLENTRPERHEQIIFGVNAVRQALQDVVKEYDMNQLKLQRGRTENEDLDLSIVHLMNKLRDLRRHLRRAIVDQVSDAFLTVQMPLTMLVETARRGDHPAIKDAANAFQAHANKIIDVARLVCEMSNDVAGVRILQYATTLCEKLTPQVINAAFLLCEKPDSAVVQENMQVFQNVWLERLRVLTIAMDSLINVNDFLSVSEAHISEDVKTGLQAIFNRDGEILDSTAGCIRGRLLRVCKVVNNEMDQYAPSPYTDDIRNAALVLKVEALPQFVVRAEKIVGRYTANSDQPEVSDEDRQRDVDEMIDACNLIYGAVNDIRRALLMNRNPEDVDSDNEYEEDGGAVIAGGGDARSHTSDSDVENQQRIMRHLPEESKREIQKQIDVFRIAQRKFEYEVGKWDDTGNDIIALAKNMCHIMTNMTDFTKGRGPYRTTMDVIKAAQEISNNGAKLNDLARQIGNECVESSTKRDLFAYLERITLFCHQLNVTSKVKADVQMVDDELRVSGLDGATSLIQNAKNLLNAVILTVKAAFIASTKYRRKESGQPSNIEWRMAQPQRGGNGTARHGADYGAASGEPNGKNRSGGIIRRVSERKPHASNNRA